ncbi:hypothetical protein IAD21_01642 [Abditibacteriota bacterium]|nr:hypothetical protein IAD21_01642 [Abditibacteriota bacterium]
MPTIEIICLHQVNPLEFPEFSFALESGSEPVSHRNLFYDEFKTLNGCIYHLGNPYLRETKERTFFAYQLLEGSCVAEGRLKFLPQFNPEIQRLFIDLLEASPIQTLIFSSDYQFGPNKVRRYKRPFTYEKFWQNHEAGQLWLNARYFIRS